MARRRHGGLGRGLDALIPQARPRQVPQQENPEGKEQVKATINYYMENARIMRTQLTKLGFKVFGGENAPYLWVKTPNNTSSWKFFEQMLYGASVVCTPGVGFGPSGEGYIRLTSFGDREDCKEAMRRIADWMLGSNK